MDWNLIGRFGVRYSLVYAGVAVGLVSVFTQSGLAFLSLFGVGLVVLLLALGGTGTVRMGAAMTNAQAMGFRSAVVDPKDLQAKQMSQDVKLLFFGIGLLVFAAIALVLAG
ncbi:hypothetical protein [Haladaptatus sp. NG-WS-4]